MKKIIVVGLLMLIIFSTTSVGGQEFETQAFENYDILSFNGTADITAQPKFTSYTTLTFNGTLNVTEGSIDTSIQPDDWNAGTPDCGGLTMTNFTFYQNGSGTIDILIGINTTNYTLVNYTTWSSSGHDRYCANFTVDNWATETMIEPYSGVPTTSLNTSVGGSTSFEFGIKIWMPKTVTIDKQEDFVIYTESSLS